MQSRCWFIHLSEMGQVTNFLTARGPEPAGGRSFHVSRLGRHVVRARQVGPLSMLASGVAAGESGRRR